MQMLPLDSPRWAELTHCYGSAANIPPLLRQLEGFPPSLGDSEPWFTLWSSLCHQDDVYPASFAAVPHIIRVLAGDPIRANFSYFQLPACIEIARTRMDFAIPLDLREPYFDALRRLPELVAAAAAREFDDTFLRCALSAIAAAKGFPNVAKAALELNPQVADQFMDWLYQQ